MIAPEGTVILTKENIKEYYNYEEDKWLYSFEFA